MDFLGIITTIMLILTVGKFITKRMDYPKLDKTFMKIHKFSSLGLFIAVVVHLVRSIGTSFNGNYIVYILGIIVDMGVIYIVISHCFMHMTKKWLDMHRKLSAVIFICFILKIVSLCI